MRFLLFASAWLCLACTQKQLPVSEIVKDNCVQMLSPQFDANWYKAKIDVVGKHISGLLLIKRIGTQETRIVFTNEAGVKFFDFGFLAGTFKVHHIMRQLNKNAVINTLKKDFEMLLLDPLLEESQHKLKVLPDSGSYTTLQGSLHHELMRLTIDKRCTKLIKIERLSPKEKLKTVLLRWGNEAIPDSVQWKHYNFNMQINLNKLHVAE
jgi:hypothetical protein